MEFINKSNARKGEKAANWKGGKKTTQKGYTVILNKEHHRASGGYVMEHIVVMEKYLGRKIKTDEAVHHINGIKSDNRVKNLEVLEFGEHTRQHHLGMKRSLETRMKISEHAKLRYKNKLEESVVNE